MTAIDVSRVAVDYAIQEVDAPEADGWECSGEYDGRVVEP